MHRPLSPKILDLGDRSPEELLEAELPLALERVVCTLRWNLDVPLLTLLTWVISSMHAESSTRGMLVTGPRGLHIRPGVTSFPAQTRPQEGPK